MKENKKVCVLLAAYNGSRYIREQLASILEQSGVNVDVYISLDKSTDNSLSIINDIAASADNVFILPYGHRFGDAASNFYNLIKNVDFHRYDYISLADQDDVWFPDKLAFSIQTLISNHADGFSSDVIAFWENGEERLVKKSFKQVTLDHLFESPGPGCTFLVSQKLALDFKRLLMENEIANKVNYHDWLLYAFARESHYKWYISERATMRYRQHFSNQIGANSGLKSFIQRLKAINSGWYRSEVLKVARVTNSNSQLISLLENKKYGNNLRLLLLLRHLRRKPIEKIFLGFILLLNLF